MFSLFSNFKSGVVAFLSWIATKALNFFGGLRMEVDLSKLSDEDKLELIRAVVAAGKIVAKASKTKVDDLFFKLLDDNVLPRLPGFKILEAEATGDVSRLDQKDLATFAELAPVVLDHFKKK